MSTIYIDNAMDSMKEDKWLHPGASNTVPRVLYEEVLRLRKDIQRFREREPLVQALIEASKTMEQEDGWWGYVRDLLAKLRDFKIGGE